MKLRFVLFLILPFLSYADCSSNGIWVFPGKSQIQTNSVFVITGYANSQEIIKGFNDKFNIYLFDGIEKVNLVVRETNIGGFSLTQAILKPDGILKPNHSYRIIIENLPEYELIERYDPDGIRTYNPEYTVIDSNDSEPPKYSEPAKIVDKTYNMYGCGPAEYVIFNCPIKDQSEYLIKANVKNLENGTIKSFYVLPFKNQLSIGHGMCSGEFSFNGSSTYEVSFEIMDASGNSTEWTQNPISFSRPTFEDQKK
ncbi:hypothetical protein HUK80_01960 [Flavobacterium sp. MAH-1]|uniref:Lipoprotein n=1 Tax=Flavobacterium agri TaxID=2743471 RepID=A0A7Y8XZI9_9FLAO|nr:hypothetical protein [Flavobacterium agri]NUY79645.1 hypothetical protein [Flavobacterium agri]NYA69670.1 hypothetical protein [Flavobacterium agri]